MQRGYFVPKANDLHLGYSCEYTDDGIVWVKTILNNCTELCSAMNNVKQSNARKYRVELLSEYHLESLDWNQFTYALKDGRQIEVPGLFVKDNYCVQFTHRDFDNDVVILNFFIYDPGKDFVRHTPIYMANRFNFVCCCRDINIFKTIVSILPTFMK